MRGKKAAEPRMRQAAEPRVRRAAASYLMRRTAAPCPYRLSPPLRPQVTRNKEDESSSFFVLCSSFLAKLAEEHGWVLARIQGSDHIFTKTGRTERLVVPMHGTHTLKVGLQRSLMRMISVEPAGGVVVHKRQKRGAVTWRAGLRDGLVPGWRPIA